MRASNLLSGLTLVGVGAVLLDFFFTGRLNQYLHPQFRLLTPAAGVILCLIGVIYAAARPGDRCCVEEGCVHRSVSQPLRNVLAILILFIPLAAGVAFSTDSFDQKAVLNRGFVQDISVLPVRTKIGGHGEQANQVIPPEALGADLDETASEPLPQNPSPATNDSPAADALPAQAAANHDDESEKYLPKTADGNISLEVTDLLYAEQEESLRRMFEGKVIEVVGQYLPGSEPTEFRLVRMLIVCCAADARPVALPVQIPGAIPASEMQWIKVTGKAVFTHHGSSTRVMLIADQIDSINPPAEAMLY
jgi:uncharacterized repeat protein (TIGR03943 family)